MSKLQKVSLQTVVDRQAGPADRSDFRSLVEENKKSVYYLALRLTGNHHDAEDLSQEAFIKALKGMNKFRGDSTIETWLHRITVNTFLNRRRKKGFGRLALYGTPSEAPDAIDSAPSPERAADSSMLQSRILAALDRLAPRERSAFVLRFYEDRTVPEIADTLGVAEGTIKSLLFRSTQKLRESLRPYHDQVQQV